MSVSDDVRAAARDFDQSQEARQARLREILDGSLPTTTELCLGQPFLEEVFLQDVATWAATEATRDAGVGPLPPAVLRHLRIVSNLAEATPIERLRRAASRRRREWSLPYRVRLQDIVDRCDLYLSHLGVRDASLRVASLAWSAWLQVPVRPSPDGLGGLERLLDALQQRPFALRDPAWDSVFAKIRLDLAGRPEVEIDERTPSDPDDLADIETALAEDRAEIVRVEPPTLVVLETVEHLAGYAKDGAKLSSASGARAEFASTAGVRLPLVHEADVASVAAVVRAEWPWASAVADAMLADLVGRAWFRFRPTLLVGPPGAGKTRLARRIGELLGMEVTMFPCAGVHDGAFGGTSRQWSTGRACVPLQAIRRGMQANPLIVLDEIEKVGTRRENGSLQDCLVPLLESESAARFHDQYVECPVDLSGVSYVATANSLDGIPGPLLDRFRVLQMPEPGPEHLGDIARRIVDELRRERGTDKTWLPDLAGDELDLIASHWRGGSLRLVRRLVETVVAGRDVLAARH